MHGGGDGKGEGGSERRREGATERGKGTWVNVGGREIGRGKLQGMYPDEDTGQYTVYIAQNYPQH